MQFKNWMTDIQEYGGGGGAATSVMHGGIQDYPGEYTNDTLPVRSKHGQVYGHKKNSSGCKFDSVEKCKKDKEGRDPDTPEDGAADKFGFKTPEDKEESKERWKRWIDKKDRSAPMRVLQVYT